MRAIICILLIFVCCIFTASALDDYDYYQSISYSACDQEIYQQDIVIHRTTGDPYEESSGGLNITHLYLNDHSQANYGDIRFTNPAGDELSYYLWPDYTSSSARFTVRLTGATSAGTLQVWYGNSAAATTSDGNTTFENYDGFEQGTGKWTTLLGGGVLSTDSTHKCSGNYSGRYVHDSSAGSEGMHIPISRTSGIIEMMFRVDSVSSDAFPPTFIQSVDSRGMYLSFNLGYIKSYDSAWRTYGTYEANRWYHLTIVVKSLLSYDLYLDGALIASNIATRGKPSEYTSLFWGAYTANSASNVDDLAIRAYSATPPTASDFSGEIYAGYVRSYPGYNIPTDPDADGLYEDVNGNGRLDFQDIMIFFQYNAWAKANQPKVECWDWSGNGAIEFSDVQAFWEAEFT